MFSMEEGSYFRDYIFENRKGTEIIDFNINLKEKMFLFLKINRCRGNWFTFTTLYAIISGC